MICKMTYNPEYRKNQYLKHIEYYKTYYEDNRDNILEKSKEYRKENRDKIAEQKKEYRENNKDKVKEKSKAEYLRNIETYKKYYEDNREKIKEQQNEKVSCECGCILSRNHLSRHRKTDKHKKKMQEKCSIENKK